MKKTKSFLQSSKKADVLLAEALNTQSDEERIRFARAIREHELDEMKKKILHELRQPEFSFITLFKNHGKEVAGLAMQIANEGLKNG